MTVLTRCLLFKQWLPLLQVLGSCDAQEADVTSVAYAITQPLQTNCRLERYSIVESDFVKLRRRVAFGTALKALVVSDWAQKVVEVDAPLEGA